MHKIISSPLCAFICNRFHTEQIIILDGNVVGLVSDSGAARWEFERLEDAVELWRLVVLSVEVEDRIAELCEGSL